MNDDAHNYTFPEMLLLGTDVPTITGHLIRHKDTDTAKWLAWQKTVQVACKDPKVVPQHVMTYFQNTKHLSRPPEKGDLGLSTKKPLEGVTSPKFTWSPSRLSTFELCPAKFAAEYYYKTVPYEESAAAVWGTRVHKQAEKFMLGEPIDDTEAFALVRPYCELLAKLPGERRVEYRIGVDEKWKALEIPKENKPWDWGEAVGRMAVDLAVIDGDSCKAFDFKTGKMKDDVLQLQLNCCVLALLHPHVQIFDAKYIWLKERKTTGFTVSRSALVPVLKDIAERLKRMREAWDSECFTARKNGLCRSWCGNLECPHNGRR